MISDRWPTEWLRGVLSVSVLAIIADGDTYGYAIAQRLEEAGLGRIKGGTLYPLLSRHEENGLITSRWEDGDGGPGRKVFTLTPEGQHRLDRLRTDWAAFTIITGGLIGAPGANTNENRKLQREEGLPGPTTSTHASGARGPGR